MERCLCVSYLASLASTWEWPLPAAFLPLSAACSSLGEGASSLLGPKHLQTPDRVTRRQSIAVAVNQDQAVALARRHMALLSLPGCFPCTCSKFTAWVMARSAFR